MAKTRWEYYISTERSSLPELGEQGWELSGVAVVNGEETFYFKRPRPSIREEITLSQRERALRKKGEEAE